MHLVVENTLIIHNLILIVLRFFILMLLSPDSVDLPHDRDFTPTHWEVDYLVMTLPCVPLVPSQDLPTIHHSTHGRGAVPVQIVDLI